MAKRRKAESGAPSTGHNSSLNSDEQLALRGFVSEIERAEANKRVIAEDISEMYKSARKKGFDTKAMRHVVKMRLMEAEERRSLETRIDAYKHALGMLADTPLGQAAIRAFGDAPFHIPG